MTEKTLAPGTKVKKSDGREGIVVANSLYLPLMPGYVWIEWNSGNSYLEVSQESIETLAVEEVLEIRAEPRWCVALNCIFYGGGSTCSRFGPGRWGAVFGRGSERKSPPSFYPACRTHP